MGPHSKRMRQIANTQDFNAVLHLSHDPALDQDLGSHLGAAFELLGEAAQINDRVFLLEAIGKAPLLGQTLVQRCLTTFKPRRHRAARALTLRATPAGLPISAANAPSHPITAVGSPLRGTEFAKIHLASLPLKVD